MKPSDRKKTLVRKWGMRAAVAAGDESSSAFEEVRQTRATPPVRNMAESNVRSRRDLNHCIAEGGADADLYCFQTSLERYFYRCELGLALTRVTLVALIAILILSFSHYGFSITRSTLSGLEVWLCDLPIRVGSSELQAVGEPSLQPATSNGTIIAKDIVLSDPATTSPIAMPSETNQIANTHYEGDPLSTSSWCLPSLAYRAVGWLEYNPALLATTVFARPWIQALLAVAIVVVSRAKRLSKVEPTRHIVDRMNSEVLQPVFGVKYDVDSNLLLVKTFE